MKWVILLHLITTSLVARPNERLRATLDALMHTPVLQVLGEVKPASIVYAPDVREFVTDKSTVPKSTEGIFKVIDEAIRDKTLNNPDLVVIFHPTLYGAGSKEKPIPHISFINRIAVAQLLQDRDAMLLIGMMGFTPPQNVDEMIALYREAVDAGGYTMNGPRDYNAIVGLTLGYPPTEVYHYARHADFYKDTDRKGVVVEAAGFALAGYKRLSEEGTWFDDWYVKNSKKLIANYKKLKGDGVTGYDLWSDPKALKLEVDTKGRVPIELTKAETPSPKSTSWFCSAVRGVLSHLKFRKPAA